MTLIKDYPLVSKAFPYSSKYERLVSGLRDFEIPGEVKVYQKCLDGSLKLIRTEKPND